MKTNLVGNEAEMKETQKQHENQMLKWEMRGGAEAGFYVLGSVLLN